MSFEPSRRVFLRGAGLTALGVGFAPSPLLLRTASAAGAGDRVLVELFLRGGADGLSLCVPHGDPDYRSLRGEIALPSPGQSGGVIDLDGLFGLHPAMGALKPLYDDGRLALLHAVGNYELSRSHFDAQSFMETGTPGKKSTSTGWLNRAISVLPGSEVTEAVAFSSRQPRSLAGPEPVLVTQSLDGFTLNAPGWAAEAEGVLREMYGSAPGAVGDNARSTFAAIDILRSTPGLSEPAAAGVEYPQTDVGASLSQAARIIKSGLGTRCIFVDVSGAFDTHANQLTANDADYASLAAALAAFAADLGSGLDDAVVMVTTEFGRTAHVNGSAGTDHGSGYCMMFLGGSVRGGQVAGLWPGLSRGQLFEERDLAVTTDYRDAFAEVARNHLGIGDTGLLFPGYSPGPAPGVVG